MIYRLLVALIILGAAIFGFVNAMIELRGCERNQEIVLRYYRCMGTPGCKLNIDDIARLELAEQRVAEACYK